MPWFSYSAGMPYINGHFEHEQTKDYRHRFLVDSGAMRTIAPLDRLVETQLPALQSIQEGPISGIVNTHGQPFSGKRLHVSLVLEKLGAFPMEVVFCRGVNFWLLGQQDFFARWGVSFWCEGASFAIFRPEEHWSRRRPSSRA